MEGAGGTGGCDWRIGLGDSRSSAAAMGRAGRDGFVVLGLLVLVAGGLTMAVALGVLLERTRSGPPPDPLPRAVRYAGETLDVRFGALTTRRYRPGERVWVAPQSGPEIAVFENASSNRLIGFASPSALREKPSPRGGRPRSR